MRGKKVDSSDGSWYKAVFKRELGIFWHLMVFMVVHSNILQITDFYNLKE